MTEIEKLAGLIDPRVKRGVMNVAFQQWPDPHDLIAASDALRQHATALEIGRGIGLQAALEACEAVYDRHAAAAKIDGVGGWKCAADHCCDAIRAASPALDVEALVERVMLAIKADMARQLSAKPLPGPQHETTDWSAEGDFQSLDLTELARAVIASLGVGE